MRHYISLQLLNGPQLIMLRRCEFSSKLLSGRGPNDATIEGTLVSGKTIDNSSLSKYWKATGARRHNYASNAVLKRRVSGVIALLPPAAIARIDAEISDAGPD
jgi:hypothetical protein